MNKLIVILILTSLASCGTKKATSKKSNPEGLAESLELGVSSNSDVVKELGQPSKTYTVDEKSQITENSGGTMYNYKNNNTFQFNHGVAKGFFRDPKKNEIHLQYWMQKWKDKKTTEEVTPGSENAHGQSDYQMTCEEDRTTIIYNKENGIVKRVMYYEK